MAFQLAPEEPEAGPWRAVLLSTVVNAVTRPRPDLGRPAVLAIDGRSNNGKTTLADRIRELVPGSVVIHTDDIAWGALPLRSTAGKALSRSRPAARC